MVVKIMLEVINILLTILISITIVFLITSLVILVKISKRKRELPHIQKEPIEPRPSREALEGIKQPIQQIGEPEQEHSPEEYSWIYQLRKRKKQ